MTDLIFSYNWNNKLYCKAFTTIRIKNEKKHAIGTEYKIKLHPKGVAGTEELGIATIKDVKYFKIEKLNDFMSYIDTGYNKEECEKIMRRMYPKIDFEKADFSFILLKYNKK